MTATSNAVWSIERAAEELLACERDRRARTKLTAAWPALDLETAYLVQDETLRRRLDRGETLIGIKLGLTSRAKQVRMGVDTPFVAWLTDAMVLPSGRPVPQDSLIHPRIEPEIVFVMGDRLKGPGVDAHVALAKVEEIYGGAEIIDSRYQDFNFDAPDVVADNASSAGYVVGSVSRHPDEIDLLTEEVLLEVDGELVDSATGAAVLGHPAHALALAANVLGERGYAIERDWTVLTGGMTDAVLAERGSSVACHFTSLGSVSLDCGAD